MDHSVFDELTAVVDALRAETVANSISPERLGSLLQRIVDVLPELDDSANIGTAIAEAVSSAADALESLVSSFKKSLPRKNLFDPANVEHESLLDSTYGKIGSWPQATKGEWAAVAKIPVTKDKYYCIINPYSNRPASRIGVIDSTYPFDYGNNSDGNIILKGKKYVIAKAVCLAHPDSFIDTLTFVLYRQLGKIEETPLVEVYEMDSVNDAISYINSRFGEDVEFSDSINLDRKILSSPNVGTFSSKYQDKTMLVLGDSLTYHGGWVAYVANRLKWKGIHNIAIGGANIVGSYSPGSGDPRNLIYQIREAANMLGDVCYAEGHLENNVYVKKVDYVFISMGYNDANNGYIAGTLDSVKSVAWTDFTPGSNYSNFPSIAAAVKYCLFYLKNTVIRGTFTVNGGTYDVALDCRTAKIMWQTPVATTSLFGSHDAEWTDSRLLAVESVISDVCEHYSVPVVNGRKLCGFTREEEALYPNGKYLKDGTHPNDAGNIKLGEMNLGAIISHF